MKNDFTQGRQKLVVLYVLIIGAIILVFSLLIVYQADDSFSDPAVKTNADVLLSATKAEAQARDLFPGREVEETEYEIQNGVLYYTVSFSDEDEVKVDLLTGHTFIPEKKTHSEMLTDDFDERVGWIAVTVFVAASLLAVYVANRTLAPISKSMRKQKQFVADAAHELRNPLAALHARLESALLPDEEVKEKVFTDLLCETKRLIAVSESLLALERSEHNGGQPEALSVKEVIQAVLSRLEFFINNKQLQIITDIDETPLRLRRTDLETVLYNLLHNAIKFSREGGIIIITWKDNTLSVADRGTGINSEKIPYIFDRFYKADMARAEEGSGLGLAIVKEIVDRNDGAISVVSSQAGGTTISIRF